MDVTKLEIYGEKSIMSSGPKFLALYIKNVKLIKVNASGIKIIKAIKENYM